MGHSETCPKIITKRFVKTVGSANPSFFMLLAIVDHTLQRAKTGTMNSMQSLLTALVVTLLATQCSNAHDEVSSAFTFAAEAKPMIQSLGGSGDSSNSNNDGTRAYTGLRSPVAVAAEETADTSNVEFAMKIPEASRNLASSPRLQLVGNGGSPKSAFPLGECEGDCDSDSDCAGAMTCYKRQGTESVPGCSGSGRSGADYCHYPRSYSSGSNNNGGRNNSGGSNNSGNNSGSGSSGSAETIFYVMGDVPYDSSQLVTLEGYINNKPSTCEFMVHVGDLRDAANRPTCTSYDYSSVASVLLKSPCPVFVLIGDNDARDCPNSSEGQSHWDDNFMKFSSHWNHNLNVVRPTNQPESFSFYHKGTLFIGVHVVKDSRGTSEWESRMSELIKWTKQLIQQYNAPTVIFAHPDPYGYKIEYFIELTDFIQNTLQNKLPILLVNGDQHT
jgi:hypothetical protein